MVKKSAANKKPSDLTLIYDDTYDNVKAYVENFGSFGLSDIPQLISFCMTLAQKVKGLTGLEKKQLVVQTITKSFDKLDLLDPIYEKTAIDFMEFVLPSMIDLVISAYRHKIDLKKIKKNCGCGK